MNFLPCACGPPPAPTQFAFGIRFLITPLLVRREVETVLRPSAFRISPRKWCENPKRMNTDKLRLMAAVSDRMNVLIHPPAAWPESSLICIVSVRARQRRRRNEPDANTWPNPPLLFPDIYHSPVVAGSHSARCGLIQWADETIPNTDHNLGSPQNRVEREVSSCQLQVRRGNCD